MKSLCSGAVYHTVTDAWTEDKYSGGIKIFFHDLLVCLVCDIGG